ncbi:MAG: hypothetical protein OXL34_15255 [Gemmatimonadota bacterium]|nr:hypothetical protein [Gemmatimonadota bacterium]
MTDGSERTLTIKNALDFEIVGENILDIADFAVEKYEFRNDTTLADEVREAAREGARMALWEMVERLKLRRKQILQAMFDKADEAVKGAIDDG